MPDPVHNVRRIFAILATVATFVSFGVQLLSGHPSWAVLLMLAGVGYLLFEANFNPWSRRNIPWMLRFVFTVVIGSALVGAYSRPILAHFVVPKTDSPNTATSAAIPDKTTTNVAPPRVTQTRRLPATIAKALCRLDNGQLADCNSDEVLDWGKPVLARLDAAIKSGRNAAIARAHVAAFANKLSENIAINDYLHNDYKNLKAYREAVIEHLKGGNPYSLDPLESLGRNMMVDGTPFLSDGNSHLVTAEVIQHDLQNLTALLIQQEAMEPKK
jgi:hypothetical protein